VALLAYQSIQTAQEAALTTAVNPKDKNYTKVEFSSGEAVTSFAETLKKLNLIRDVNAFVKYASGSGDTGIQAGTYYIQPSMDVKAIYNLLNDGPNTDVMRTEFIETRSTHATELYKKYNIFASVNLAQAILESEWGQSTLASKYNNYYGIKAIGDQKSVTLETQENIDGQMTTVKAAFAVYDSWQDGMDAHTKFLIDGTTSNPDQFIDVKNAQTYQEQVHALVIDGYATDPDYEKNLLDVIQTYELYKYDKK
jgi:uncharacterized FlgJ-related protein